jgi:uncharacterized membrane protein
LLELFGQTYQTGADSWELFATWGALIAPWVIIGCFDGLWILWIAIANTALVFYFRVSPGFPGVVFSTEHEIWTGFIFNTAALAVWELLAPRFSWMAARTAPRLLAIVSGSAITWLMLQSIFEWRGQSGAALLVYPAWLGCAYAMYRVKTRDLLILAGGCLSVIIVVTTFLAKNMFNAHQDSGAFLFIALAVVAMAAAAGWWLKQVGREDDK